jgi:hypothetical protein
LKRGSRLPFQCGKTGRYAQIIRAGFVLPLDSDWTAVLIRGN